MPGRPDEPGGLNVTVNSRTFGSLLQIVGGALVLFGAFPSVRWPLIAGGTFLGIVGFVARSGFRFGQSSAAFDDALLSSDGTLQLVGDEVRSANGYTVRKLTDGIQYVEGDRSLSIRATAPEATTVSNQPQFQESITRRSSGGHASFTSVTVKVTSKNPLHWDAPNENEPISQDRMAEISERIAHAVTYYEMHVKRQ